jgi:menaquinone-dependent protoporphyrinogen oxidase
MVVYCTKYGSTAEVAQAIADGLGADIAEMVDMPDIHPYGLIVIGSPVYSGTYLPAAIEFLEANKHLLAVRRVAAFITAAADTVPQLGLTGDVDPMLYTQQDYADGLAQLTHGEVVGARGFGGRLIPEKLDEADLATLDWFYRRLMSEKLHGFDLLDLPSAYRWGEELRAVIGG